MPAAGNIAMKTQVQAASTRKADPALLAKLTDHALFVEKKRGEASLRDISCKAVCAIKHAARQPGAQADGRPAIPDTWNDVFKPQLGSFMKFVLGRPDQFRVVEGTGPGFYTVENIAGNQTVVAPSWDGKGKGKGKPWSKGGKPWEEKGKGKAGDDKGKGKGKDFGKAWGKPWASKGKSDGKASKGYGGKAAAPATTARETPAKVLPMSARLLAAVAKEELAAEEFEEEAEEAAVEEAPEEDDAAADEEAWEEDVTGNQEAEALAGAEGDEAEHDEGAEADAAADDDEKDDADHNAPKHGSFIGSLLSSGLLKGRNGSKRPVSGGVERGDAKRLR